jgi:LPXTG-motif cell wall-anchored protein
MGKITKRGWAIVLVSLAVTTFGVGLVLGVSGSQTGLSDSTFLASTVGTVGVCTSILLLLRKRHNKRSDV